MMAKGLDEINQKFLRGICKNNWNPDYLYLLFNDGDDLKFINIYGTVDGWIMSDHGITIPGIDDNFALFKPINETIKCVATITDTDSISYLIYTETKVIEFESIKSNAGIVSTWSIENLCGTITNETLYDLLYDTTDDPIFSKLN